MIDINFLKLANCVIVLKRFGHLVCL